MAKGVKVNHSHKLSALLKLFEENYGDNELSNIISNYIDQDKLKEPLHLFFKKSSVTTDQFYQALKYPESNKGDIFFYEELTEKGIDGVYFFKTFTKDVDKIRREAVKLGYTLIEDEN